MAERLVILSDMWGSKKGLWITSYLGYLQQYFDIVFHDSRHLADIRLNNHPSQSMVEALHQGGLNMAVAQLLKKEKEPSHYLTFGAGGTIAWKAGLSGLPIKSLTALSPLDLHLNDEKPDIRIKLIYGEFYENIPSNRWATNMDLDMEIFRKFGRDLYSDEKIIQKVSLELLEALLKNTLSFRKRPLVS